MSREIHKKTGKHHTCYGSFPNSVWEHSNGLNVLSMAALKLTIKKNYHIVR